MIGSDTKLLAGCIITWLVNMGMLLDCSAFFFARNILELVFGFIFLSQMTVLVATRGGLDTSTGIAIALK
jgi:hypothetical protein